MFKSKKTTCLLEKLLSWLKPNRLRQKTTGSKPKLSWGSLLGLMDMQKPLMAMQMKQISSGRQPRLRVAKLLMS